MHVLQYLLVILFALAMLVSGLGDDPLARFIPGMGSYVLLGLCALALLLMLVRRFHNLEERVSRSLGRFETAEKHWQTTAARFEMVAATVTQLSEQICAVQQTMTHNEQLLPGRLALIQRRPEEAAKMFQDVLASHPNNVEAHWLLGEALFRTKRHADALPHLLAGLVDTDVHRLARTAQCEQALGRYADAEAHLLQVIEARGEPRQDDLVALGAVQSELEPIRARATLMQALELNPYNSVARYQLIALETRTGAYDRAVVLATEGLACNPADVGCYVSRAEAYYRGERLEDEAHILDDLATAQAKNRKDYNIYRLRGALHQRRASRADESAAMHKALHDAIAAYEDGLANVPPKFHAHLLAAESRVFLQLRRFDDAASVAQRAVENHAGHVSNHLALAFARLAAGQWKPAVQAADKGLQWAGWGGRIWLTAIGIFANTFVGVEPSALQQKCAALAADLKADAKRFALSESWGVVREVLQETAAQTVDSHSALVTDTIALLERTMTPEQYRRRWVEAQRADGRRALYRKA